MLVLFFITFLSACIEYDSSTLEISINPGVDTIELNGVFIDAGAKATINGNIKRSYSVIFNNVDTSQIGTYQVIYETIFNDIKKHTTRYIVVMDQKAPKITLNSGVDTIFIDEEWFDAGVTVVDNSQEDIVVSVSGSVISSIIGEYVITYTAVDIYGNTSVAYRFVYVVNRSSSNWIND